MLSSIPLAPALLGGANIPAWVLRSGGIAAAVDADFVNNRYFGGQLSDLLTCSRASTGYAQTAAGLLVPFANNVLRVTDLGLLAEEAQTNVCLQSQTFDNSSWSRAAVGVSVDAAVAPDGTTTADLISANGTSAQHNVAMPSIVANATTYTLSVYAKPLTANFLHFLITGINLYVQFDLSTGATVFSVPGAGTITASGFVQLANGWRRYWMTFTQSPGGTGNQALRFYPLNASQNAVGPIEASTASVYLWGAFLGAGPLTSYVQTTNSSASRSADVIGLSGLLASLLNSSVRGSAVAAVAGLSATRSGNAAIFSSSPALPLFINATGTGKASTFNGTNSLTLALANTWNAGAKAALGWDGSGRSIVSTGNTLLTDANAIGLGAAVSLAAGGNALNAYLQRLSAFPSRLSDAGLTALVL